MDVGFSTWTEDRSVRWMSTNNGSPELAFQGWRHFKESFTPELVARAVRENPTPVSRCVDPFGGSGTTALACQFLDVEPVTIEVNPYLADLIEAKLVSYDTTVLVSDLGRVLRRSKDLLANGSPLELPAEAPKTLVEPGADDRWVFSAAVANRLGALIRAADSVEEPSRRLFRVLIGGILVDLSNVIVNGKGRRYRDNWRDRPRNPDDVERLFLSAARKAILDIYRFADRACLEYTVLRGDSRSELEHVGRCELAVFSPPYPNSFDYTDVYNLELWVLGYLADRCAASGLRQSTVYSHVQVRRQHPTAPEGSSTLVAVTERLGEMRSVLWNRNIPEMVVGYFADMAKVLEHLKALLGESGQVWMVVGDSRYAGVQIPVVKILSELASHLDFRAVTIKPFRSMRSSAQQGGQRDLAESLIVLEQS